MNLMERRTSSQRTSIEAARGWLEVHHRVALATVVSTWGASPVPVGGQLAVAPGERFEGSVSGGCVEADVIAEAADVMAEDRPRLLEFGVAEETAWRAGLPCGGTIKVLIEPLERERDHALLCRILEAWQARQPIAIVTNVATGERRLYDEGSAMPRDVAAYLTSGQSQLIASAEGNQFVHALLPAIQLIIVGATHVGQILSGIARGVGYDITVVDPRAAFATEERFGDTHTVDAWPDVLLPAMELDARTAVVALTHASHIDDGALTAALRSECFYIGALGSRRTHAQRIERLQAMGFSEADLARIHAPIGLAIGAEGPAEIAVSILAEVIKVARGAE